MIPVHQNHPLRVQIAGVGLVGLTRLQLLDTLQDPHRRAALRGILEIENGLSSSCKKNFDGIHVEIELLPWRPPPLPSVPKIEEPTPSGFMRWVKGLFNESEDA